MRLWSLHLPELPAACLLNGDNDDICLRNNAWTIPTLPCRHTGALTEWQGSSLPLHHVTQSMVSIAWRVDAMYTVSRPRATTP